MPPSKVWQHFSTSNKNKEATCNYCDEVLQHNGSTSCLWNHYNYKHNHENGVNATDSEDKSSSKKRSLNCCYVFSDSCDKSDEATSSESPTKKRKTRVTSEMTKIRILSKERQELITQALTEMIAMDLLPLSFVENKGFKFFMSIIEPEYKTPSRKTITDRIQTLYNNEVDELKKVVDAQSTLAFTTDCWTSRTQQAYMTITAQYLDSHWMPQSVNLLTEEFSESHTAVNLEDCIRDTVEEWNAAEKLSAIVHDNASNITNAVKFLYVDGIRSSPCAAHTLQFSINKGLKLPDCKSVITKVSEVISAFNHSFKRTTALEKHLEQTNKPVLNLIQSCPTRWNSTLAMLERFGELRPSIIAVLSDRSIFNSTTAKKLELREEDWEKINLLTSLLQPLKIATTVICADQTITISLVRLIVHSLIKKHLKENKKDIKLAKDFKSVVVADLKKRFHFEDDLSLKLKNDIQVSQIASFLDPRYKNLQFEESEDDRKLIKSIVQEMFDEIKEMKSSAENKTRTAMDFLLDTTFDEESEVDEFECYLQEPQIHHNANPSVWWKDHEDTFPNIAKIAKKFLAIPATSASSERAFSSAGNIIRPARSCLTSYMVSSLIFLHQNKKVWSKRLQNKTI